MMEIPIDKAVDSTIDQFFHYTNAFPVVLFMGVTIVALAIVVVVQHREANAAARGNMEVLKALEMLLQNIVSKADSNFSALNATIIEQAKVLKDSIDSRIELLESRVKR